LNLVRPWIVPRSFLHALLVTSALAMHRATRPRITVGSRSLDLDEDDRRSDGLIHQLRECWGRRDRGERLVDASVDVLLGQRPGCGKDEVEHDDRAERHCGAEDVGCRPREPARSPRRSSIGLHRHVVHPCATRREV